MTKLTKMFTITGVLALTVLAAACGKKDEKKVEEKPVATKTPYVRNTATPTPTTAPEDLDEVGKQLKVITDNKDVWFNNSETEGTTVYYAVTDLDRNDKLEIISAYTAGTGLFTTAHIYEVESLETGLVERTKPEEDATNIYPEIVTDHATRIYDKNTGIYSYVFKDAVRESASSSFDLTELVSLKDGFMKVSTRAGIHTTVDSSNRKKTEYVDPDLKVIDEVEYAIILNSMYIGEYEIGENNFLWSDLKDVDIPDTLKHSYYRFINE